ncbi:MAG: Hsp20/alpha crystallin family protein [Candidatus Hydrogenedentes bacterium]|nr:Hsp20/alpha crystallin family protein [Candidatus Hydrogenedentota bacterium]
MKETTVPANTEKNVPDTREETRMLTPQVDIFETEEGLMIIADLPGIDQEQLDINIEKNILTLKTKEEQEINENLARQEYQLLPFFRQFQLSDVVDQSKVTAEIKNGVVTISLPKVAQQQPCKITVKVA